MEEFEKMLPELLVRSMNFIEIWVLENDRASYAVAHQSILFAYHSILFHVIKSNPLILLPESDKVANNRA